MPERALKAFPKFQAVFFKKQPAFPKKQAGFLELSRQRGENLSRIRVFALV